jgi:hypothetical protein
VDIIYIVFTVGTCTASFSLTYAGRIECLVEVSGNYWIANTFINHITSLLMSALLGQRPSLWIIHKENGQ